MAIGNTLSFAIEAKGNSALVKLESMSTGGTFDLGIGENNSLTNAKIKLNFTRPGYTNGVLTTKAFQVCAVPCSRPDLGAMRKRYPDDADPNITVDGSDVIIRLALSRPIHDTDTLVSAEIESGFYNDGTNDNLAETSFSVTNNSALVNPVCGGNTYTAPMQRIAGNDLHVEIGAFHKYGIDCVKITATDGTNSQTRTISSATVSENSPLGAIIAYQADFALSEFINLSLIKVSYVIYPLYAPALSIRNSDDGVNAYPTWKYTNLQYRLDKTDSFGKIKVDATNGNDTTGTVYATEAEAEAGLACQTIASAMTKLQAYHNSNFTINTAAGGTVLLTAETHSYGSSNGGTGLTEWVTIKPVSTATKATTFINIPASNSSMSKMCHFKNLTLTGTGFYTGNNSAAIYLENVELANTGTYTVYAMNYGFAENLTGSHSYGLRILSSGFWAVVRGCVMDSHTRCAGFTTIGCSNVNLEGYTLGGNYNNDNIIYAYNIEGQDTLDTAFLLGGSVDVDGLFLIQNLFIRVGSQTQPLVMIAADSSTAETNNINIWNNTLAGARINIAYNDSATGATAYHTNWSVHNNIFSNYNTKDDTFKDNPLGFGGEAVGYGCDFSGNLFRSCALNEWLGEFSGAYAKWGSSSVPLNPQYVLDNSADVNDVSTLGDYHLTALSPSIALTKSLYVPYDFEGNGRSAVDASGIYRYYVASENKNNSFGSGFSGWGCKKRGWA